MAPKKKETAHVQQDLALDSDQQKVFQEKVKELKAKTKHGLYQPGVVYVGHIPRGFFEHQMKSYFSQFGKVKRIKLSRSKKTGRPKGYAFIEFESEEVAKIVADSMNNYLMFHRLLKCKFCPSEDVHPDTFIGSGRMFKRPKAHAIVRDRHNKLPTPKQRLRAIKKLNTRTNKKLAKLAAMGIDYSFEGLYKEKKKVGWINPHQDSVHILEEDSSEDEITFITPPKTVRSSSVGATPGKTPKTPKSRTATPDSTGIKSTKLSGKGNTTKNSVSKNKTKKTKATRPLLTSSEVEKTVQKLTSASSGGLKKRKKEVLENQTGSARKVQKVKKNSMK
ncbi:MKI67 FHA domain-interacting nucleolar phosphoprotein-like [Lingula anatina]|uniref:MKI67 FHA domain-interacting nucleolar phosphoprotein-like n=1 Tax=Lingula anatina TaxID=7574 RepID=A0A1S3J5E9_LINAN|nr:MKI67 FHA domain-interacting nucleolar phosphoprotein-like [Lingula anatina]|eukprot:XP_013405523.1 MKI67 FHA domain-interacting nucleolar phosphoprotein-like [Lingula anatina]